MDRFALERPFPLSFCHSTTLLWWRVNAVYIFFSGPLIRLLALLNLLSSDSSTWSSVVWKSSRYFLVTNLWNLPTNGKEHLALYNSFKGVGHANDQTTWTRTYPRAGGIHSNSCIWVKKDGRMRIHKCSCKRPSNSIEITAQALMLMNLHSRVPSWSWSYLCCSTMLCHQAAHFAGQSNVMFWVNVIYPHPSRCLCISSVWACMCNLWGACARPGECALTL